MADVGKYGFGTFKGVFTPSILTIIGVVMYLRFGWVLGNVGLWRTLALVTLGTSITFLTGLSISALATNMRMKGGGAYFMLSRSFGVESGAAIGIPLALSQAIAVAFYVAGFVEGLGQAVPAVAGVDPRLVGLGVLVLITALLSKSADLALKAQYVVMAVIALSLASFFLGSPPAAEAVPSPADVPAPLGFWAVMAVFFPAVTGILSGLGMSGDLKSPERSIPIGTIGAVLVGYLIYMAVPVFLHSFVSDPAVLRTDYSLFQKCARWGVLVTLGILAATLSSAIGSLLAAPRVFQALSGDRVLPAFIGRGFGRGGDPLVATALVFALAGVCVWLGDINAIAPVLTMFNLTTYAFLNLSAALEEAIGNPSWRPTFRVRASLSFAGFAGCLAMMLMISPGWTFVAIALEVLVYWLMKRRALKARWGDMRLGILMAVARVAARKISQREGDSRNWRPDLMVFVGSPARRSYLVELAGAISQNRCAVTAAAVIPEEAWNPDRAKGLGEAIGSFMAEKGVEAQVVVHPAANTWTGMRELVRTYGWGPFVPNTFLVGPSLHEETAAEHAATIAAMTAMRRNVVIVSENGGRPRGTPPKIDIWWRGRQGNAPFMLALAFLMLRSDGWRGAHLRICHLAEAPDKVEEGRRMIGALLASARVKAEGVVLPPNTVEEPLETICRASAESDIVFLGLRKAGAGEDPASYGAYLHHSFAATAGLPLVIFAIAAEGVDFKSIFE